MRLPSLMEEVHAWWDEEKCRPQFKAEYIITHNIQASLTAAGKVTAERLGLSGAKAQELIATYQGLPHPVPAQKEASGFPTSCSQLPKTAATTARKFIAKWWCHCSIALSRRRGSAVSRFDASTHFYFRAEKDFRLASALQLPSISMQA